MISSHRIGFLSQTFMHLLSLTVFILQVPICMTAWDSLVIWNVTVPETVNEGSNVTLVCTYTMGDFDFYRMSWYRNSAVFYQFTPKDDPQKVVFGDLKVDLLRSNEKSVTITQLEKGDTGKYACEVKAKTPLELSTKKGKFMNVKDKTVNDRTVKSAASTLSGANGAKLIYTFYLFLLMFSFK